VAALDARGSGKPPREGRSDATFDELLEDFGRQLTYLAEPEGTVTEAAVRLEEFYDKDFLGDDD
jgi:hypothetical protein